MGRFLQEDTYRGDGLNLYAYCVNNPVVYYDPSGHGTQYPDEVPKTVDTPGAAVNANDALADGVGNNARRGPKPKGTGTHNKKIEEVGNQITDGTVIAGGGKLPERKINTPGGKKVQEGQTFWLRDQMDHNMG